MKELKLKKIWFFLGLVGVALIWDFSLTVHPPAITESFPLKDKGGHFTCYFLITFWFDQIFSQNHFKKITLVFILMGVLLECLQGMTDYRYFELLDILANSLGAIGGLIAAHYISHQLLIKLETKLYNDN